MTAHVVALTQRAPDADVLRSVLADTVPELRIATLHDGAMLEFFDASQAFVAALEAPSQISIPGEAIRLLGVTSEPDPPYWWIELRSPLLRPDGVEVALRIADRLVAVLGGTVWRSGDPS